MNEIFQNHKPRIIRTGIEFAVFNAVCIFAEVTGITLLSAGCIATLLGFIGAIVFVQLKDFVDPKAHRDDAHHIEVIKTDRFKRYYENLYVGINNLIQGIRKAALLSDPIFTAKVLIALFFISYVAGQTGDYCFVWLIGVGYILYPVIMLFFGTHIKAGLQKAEETLQSSLKKQKKD